MEFGNYIKEQENEKDVFNDANQYIKAWQNKRPEFDYIEVKSMTATSATIKVRATDVDGEKLTYILYMGNSKDNLVEKAKKENIEQGTEIELIGEGINIESIAYYRVDVIDAYETIQSQISTLQNKKPVIEKAEITDITRISAKVAIKGTYEDAEDKLTYRIIYRNEQYSNRECRRYNEKSSRKNRYNIRDRSNIGYRRFIFWNKILL